jgi:hypothetical protein
MYRWIARRRRTPHPTTGDENRLWLLLGTRFRSVRMLGLAASWVSCSTATGWEQENGKLYRYGLPRLPEPERMISPWSASWRIAPRAVRVLRSIARIISGSVLLSAASSKNFRIASETFSMSASCRLNPNISQQARDTVCPLLPVNQTRQENQPHQGDCPQRLPAKATPDLWR